jgi:ribosomal protein L3
METRVGGGSVGDRVEFALDLLDEGGVHEATDVFRAGEYADVAGITKGKGTQGPVKRWGVQKRKGNTPGRGGADASATSARGTPPASGRPFPSRGRRATTSARN